MSYFLFITTDKYPEGDAGAVRTESFARICKKLGYDCVVIGLGDYTKFKYKERNGIKYCSLRFPGESIITRIAGRALFSVLSVIKILNFSNKDIAGIMTCAGNNSLLSFLKRFSTKNNIPVIFDSVEWYSPSEFESGEKNYFYKKNDELNRKLITQPIKVVAISTYLEKYFSNKGLDVVRIPIILDVDNIDYSYRMADPDVIHIVYAGTPGNKDHLLELIIAVNELTTEEQERLSIKVIGIDKKTFYQKWWSERNDEIPNVVNFEGRKPREYVLTEVVNSDFAFLLRPSEERYAKAGFPTKVAEACSCGTAMLCNYSSDLEIYLKELENCIIIPECSISACKTALRKLLSLNVDQIEKMKKNSRETAIEWFDWNMYVEEINRLIINKKD